ncbi:MAG TPA: N-acetylneuraminate synthase family protein [Candidatus Paceibacterota bacterium]
MASRISILGTNKTIGDGVFFIAEIGKNFIQTEGERPVAEYLENAKKLVKAAKEAGADAVKFQTHEVEDEQLNIDITSPHFKGADRYSWITRNMAATPIETFWKPLKKYCDEIGILFFSTPMSRKAAMKLEEVGVPLWKVGSGDVQDYVTLDFMFSTKKPVIISSGMVSLAELDEVINHIRDNKAPLVVLYCISQYPAPKEYFNLATIEYLTEKYPEVVIGFSDHSLGDEVALAAVKLGAKVIEKHFSFSRDLWGADHKVSMTPEEFKRMVDTVRSGAYQSVETAPYYGRKDKDLEGANNQFRPYFNKSLMAGMDIPAGAIITRDMVFAMRPKMYAKGLPAQEFPRVLGRAVKQALKKFDPLTEEVLS